MVIFNSYVNLPEGITNRLMDSSTPCSSASSTASCVSCGTSQLPRSDWRPATVKHAVFFVGFSGEFAGNSWWLYDVFLVILLIAIVALWWLYGDFRMIYGDLSKKPGMSMGFSMWPRVWMFRTTRRFPKKGIPRKSSELRPWLSIKSYGIGHARNFRILAFSIEVSHDFPRFF